MNECEKSEYMKDERNDAEIKGLNYKRETDKNEDPMKRSEKRKMRGQFEASEKARDESFQQKGPQLLGQL